MNDRGIVYVATKTERYVEEAFLSAESAKRQIPGISVTLFTDLPDCPLCATQCFDKIRPVDSVSGFSSAWAEGLLNRILCLSQTPYEYTLHIDTDTRILSKEVGNLFTLLDEIEVGMVETADDASVARMHYARPMFNGGLILYRKTDLVLRWLKDWAHLSRDYFTKAGEHPLPHVDVIAHVADESIRRRLLSNDQTSLVTMLSPDHSSHGLKFANLDYSWNHTGSRAAKHNRHPARIVHSAVFKRRTHYDILQVARNWEEQGRSAQVLYDYLERRSTPALRGRGLIARFLRPKQMKPEQWRTPRLTRADLHHRYGQLATADALYREADTDEHAYAAAGRAELNLTSGEIEAALALANVASQLNGTSPYISRVLGRTLAGVGRHIDALPYLRWAEKKGDPESAHQVGQSLLALADYRGAAKAYTRALRRNPDAHDSANNLMPALLGSRDYAGALRIANALIARYSWHPPALAFKCVALAELGHVDEERELADLDRLVSVETLTAPRGFENISAFNRVVARALEREPSLRIAPAQHATRHGLHSGDLSEANDAALASLKNHIIEAVLHRRNSIPSSATHLFERSRPDTFTYRAWTVIMEQQGHQIPHIHAKAWLSGVYYVQVPPEIRADDPTHSGWLAFGRGESRWHTEGSRSIERLIFPEPGMLVTFPSFIWHSTVPLRSAARRISYAFDILPTS